MARYGRADWKSRKIYSAGCNVEDDKWNAIFGNKKTGVSGVYAYVDGKLQRVVDSNSIACFDRYYNQVSRLTSSPFLRFK